VPRFPQYFLIAVAWRANEEEAGLAAALSYLVAYVVARRPWETAPQARMY
jgi:hypothetical protein